MYFFYSIFYFLFFSQSLDDGLLMYCSQKYRGEGDFASLAIRNKRLEFRFNTGSGTATLQSEPLFQDEWVEVSPSAKKVVYATLSRLWWELLKELESIVLSYYHYLFYRYVLTEQIVVDP